GDFLRKRGAVFVDERNGRRSVFSFDEGLPGTPGHAHHVDRASFDLLLLQAAERAGARVLQEHLVTAVDFDDAGVTVQVQDLQAGEGAAPTAVRARYLVDASGQKALLARRGKTVDPIPNFGRAAAFRRYDGLAPAIAAELQERGDIIVKIIDDGWMWAIPLAGASLSVGMVKASGKLEAATLEREIAESPLLGRLLAAAQGSEIGLLGNFSYRNTAPYGARYVCIGDAACFLDPVFSSGIALALAGAETMADLLAPALAAGSEAEPELMQPLSRHMQRAYDAFARFIHRFYHTRLVDNVLLGEHSPDLPFRSGVISVLAADVWREDNPFLNMLLGAQRVGGD
ncbi:MAG: tryptophan 7-halogenase, partial [Myxococcales bacterium]|nr:tryptophan 7-halogenase [Myxococcales bacterium]